MISGIVAKIFVVNEKREALMLRTGVYKAHPEKSHQPDLPGGFVDEGESEKEAVVRELFEEAGVTIDIHAVNLGYAETLFYEGEGKSITKLLYVVTLKNTPKVTLSYEHEDYEWTPVDSFLAVHTMRPFYAEGIAYLLEHKLV